MEEHKEKTGNYDDLLNCAFESVKPCVECERFELKKVESHISGNKTIIANFRQIADCLRRQPEHFAKFLFNELASYGEISGDRLVLTRKIPRQQITEKIKLYASKFVICPKCKKPDTELVEQEGKKYLRCLACGNKAIVTD